LQALLEAKASALSAAQRALRQKSALTSPGAGAEITGDSDQVLAALQIKVCPLFAALSQDVQMEAFAPAAPGVRKVILSTNVAETSVTINGKFVRLRLLCTAYGT
jgi:HrpA-like RNA helicase